MTRNATMREACFVVSNIAAEGGDMLQAVLDAGILKEISALLEMADYETRKEVSEHLLSMSCAICMLITFTVLYEYI